MRRITMMVGALLFAASPVFAQTPPAQITNDDLLKLIGLQQVQQLQCGKALETALQEVTRLAPKPEPAKTPQKP